MNIDDINQEEFKRLLATAEVQKLSYLDPEIRRIIDSGQVSLIVCRLDENNWVAAATAHELPGGKIMAWCCGTRCQHISTLGWYEPEAFIQEIYKITNHNEQNQHRLIVIPVSLSLRDHSKLTPRINHSGWTGRSESSRKSWIARVIAEQITSPELITPGSTMDMFMEKIPNIAEAFDPFEL